MALHLVHKHDLSYAATLSSGEQQAIRAVAQGDEGEEFEALVLHVVKRARKHGLWLRCDCGGEDGRWPLVAPCLSHCGTAYWRVLAGQHVQHDPDCFFYRRHANRSDKAQWDRSPRKAPEGFFAVLREPAQEQRVSRPGRRSKEKGDTLAGRRPALSQRLLMLMERAALNQLPPVDTLGDGSKWQRVMRARAAEIEIAPDRPLSKLWFDHIRTWKGELVHARVREAAREWPTGHVAQGFLCWVVRDVDAHGVGSQERNDRVDVLARVGRPVVGRNPVPGPYLFLGAVGLPEGRSGYECLQAYAQPIVARDCPVPVDSHYERQAFRTLRITLRVLSRRFPDAKFALEKPVFEFDTPDGPCLPDFLIRARRGIDELTFVVEVMGFERPEYLRAKEVTHPRMETLGTLCTMQAGEFDRSRDGLTAEGSKVTQTVRQALQYRWA